MAEAEATKVAVLLVDDRPTDLLIGEIGLAERGFAVVTAEGAAEAMAFLSRGSLFHLALVDLNMPGMDGLELVRWIREESPAKRLPVLIFTSSDRDADKRDARAAGADGFLQKPLTLDGFDAVAEAIRQRLAR